MNRLPLLIASALYILLFFLLFPWYRYIIDIDAISYIHVAQRYARGDYATAVNGYWSPLISWVLVPFIKTGWDPVTSAKYVNGFIGLLCIFVSDHLTARFNIHTTIRKVLPFIFAIIFLSYAFYELCADLLQLFLLLCYLSLVFSKNFIHNYYKIAAAAVLAALCYYAKAYSFPFFLCHMAVMLFVLLKRNKIPQLSKAFFTRIVVAFGVFFLLTAPYLVVLTNKYGSFRINNAGRLNTSWFLSPGISDNRKMVPEMPYADATSYWDEPTYAQEKYVNAFTSTKFFFKQIKWAISNSIKFAGLLNLISIFSFLIFVSYVVLLYRRKKENNDHDWLLLLTTIIYPSGYLLIFIEWRYIWMLPVCLLLMMGVVLTYFIEKGFLKKRLLLPVSIITAGSFLLEPVNEMQDLRYYQQDVYEMAAIFKRENIKGNFFLNYKSFEPFGKTVVLSYLTGSKFYGPVLNDHSFDELMTSAKKFNIQYYLYFYDTPSEKESFLQSPYAKAGIKTYADLYPGLIVIQFK